MQQGPEAPTTNPCNSLPATINQTAQGTSELSFMVANSHRVCVDDRRGPRRARPMAGWLPPSPMQLNAARTPKQRPQSRQTGWWSMPALLLATSQSQREIESRPSPGLQRWFSMPGMCGVGRSSPCPSRPWSESRHVVSTLGKAWISPTSTQLRQP